MTKYQIGLCERIGKALRLDRDFNQDADVLRPRIYTENHNLLNLVHTHEATVSTFDGERPVLATLGLGPCIALAGYDPKQRVGFLSHNCVGDYVESLHDLVLDELHNGGFNVTSMHMYLVGGMIGSGDLASSLRECAKKFNPISINEDLALKISDWKYLGKSFVLDTRNGGVFSVGGKDIFSDVPPAQPTISLDKIPAKSF